MGVGRLETLRQFLVNFFGFSALDVSSCLQATFDSIGKGHQRKRHNKPRHRQPESTASGTTSRLQVWHYHRRSASSPDPPESNEELRLIEYTNNIGSSKRAGGLRRMVPKTYLS